MFTICGVLHLVRGLVGRARGFDKLTALSRSKGRVPKGHFTRRSPVLVECPHVSFQQALSFGELVDAGAVRSL